jgi:WhiB family redox-sensing transcriptional regulator
VPYPKFDGTQPCTRIGVEAYFAGGDEHEHNRQVKALCGPCPMRSACLEYALAHDVRGIWGGTGYQERRIMRAEMGIRAVPVSADIAEASDLATALAAVDTGALTLQQVADVVGCSAKTVERHRAKRKKRAA